MAGLPGDGERVAFPRGQPIVVGDTLGRPAQKAVKSAGGRPDVVAGHHPGAQQTGQRVHQLKAHAVVSLGGHPNRNPDIGAGRGAGQDIPGGAQQSAALLGQHKLGPAAAARVVVTEKFRPVEQGQAHVEMGVDKINDAALLAGAGQAKHDLRQWRSLPLPAG